MNGHEFNAGMFFSKTSFFLNSNHTILIAFHLDDDAGKASKPAMD
jgi:hypothetical protein